MNSDGLCTINCWMILFLYLIPVALNGQTDKVLVVGQSTQLVFTSGVNNEKGKQQMQFRLGEEGYYVLELVSDNNPLSGHWLLFDCIYLESAEIAHKMYWMVGEEETPPEYGPSAFDEFNPYPKSCKRDYYFGYQGRNSDVSELCKELNDGAINSISIWFPIESAQINEKLSLTISTLSSSHMNGKQKIPEFRMKVMLKKAP